MRIRADIDWRQWRPAPQRSATARSESACCRPRCMFPETCRGESRWPRRVATGRLGDGSRSRQRAPPAAALVSARWSVYRLRRDPTAARRPSTQPLFADYRVRQLSSGRARYEAAIRIPLGTALGEELIFRGALFGLLRRRHSTFTAVTVSSLLFGLWHVLPTRSTACTPTTRSLRHCTRDWNRRRNHRHGCRLLRAAPLEWQHRRADDRSHDGEHLRVHRGPATDT